MGLVLYLAKNKEVYSIISYQNFPCLFAKGDHQLTIKRKIIIIVLATQGMFKLELSITTAYILPVKLRKSTHIGIFLFKD